MAISGYMFFQDYKGNYQTSESQVDSAVNPKDNMWKTFNFSDAQANNGLFEIEDFSFDIEQVLNIGSQSTGAGAGKVTFNPFSITRKIDCFSPLLFQNACSGTPYQKVSLGLQKSSGGNTAAATYLVFNFKLVAVKTISWSYDDEAPKETVTFEYGGLQCFYSPQNPDGSFKAQVPGGWNRVKNISDTTNAAIQ